VTVVHDCSENPTFHPTYQTDTGRTTPTPLDVETSDSRINSTRPDHSDRSLPPHNPVVVGSIPTGPTQPHSALLSPTWPNLRDCISKPAYGTSAWFTAFSGDFDVPYGDVAALLSTLVGRAHDSDDGRAFEGAISIADQVFALMTEDLIITKDSTTRRRRYSRLHPTAHLSVWNSIQTLMSLSVCILKA
jgi:hypothetical protein